MAALESVPDVSELREKLRRFTASRSNAVAAPPGESRAILPVPIALGQLFPHGGLRRGSVVTRSGSDVLLVGLLAAVAGQGGQVAVVGHRELGLLAAVEQGAQLDRIAVIPDPGVDPIEIASVLLDGLDLVVLDQRGISIPPSRARILVARARAKGSVLLVTGRRCHGAEVSLHAMVTGYPGMAEGVGRIQGCQLEVRALVTGQVRSVLVAVQPDAAGQMAWSATAGVHISAASYQEAVG